MKIELVKKGVKLTLCILIFSIICLIFLSFFPIISVTENDYVKDNLYFNLEMMKKSNNQEIVNLANQINFINFYLWIIIILCLITLIIINNYITSNQSFKKFFIIFILVISILIINILALNLQNSLINKIENSSLISFSTIIPKIKYFYISFIFSTILLIFSILLNILIISHLIKKILIFSNDKKIIKKEKIENNSKDPNIVSILHEQDVDKKIIELEEFFKKEINSVKKNKYYSNDIIQPSLSTDDCIDDILKEKMDIKTNNSNNSIKSKFNPFSTDKPKESHHISSEINVSESFEDALRSAIDKRINNINQNESKTINKKDAMVDQDLLYNEKNFYNLNFEIDNKDKNNKNKININEIILECDECKYIFSFKKENKLTKIKCPKCGKEGQAK